MNYNAHWKVITSRPSRNDIYEFVIKKYKTFSVLIYNYINTSGNWKNEKLYVIQFDGLANQGSLHPR